MEQQTPQAAPIKVLNPIQYALRTMDRSTARKYHREYEKQRMKWPEHFVEQPVPEDMVAAGLLKVWRNREFLVQLWQKPGDPLRLSVNRTEIDVEGRWLDGITWDHLQYIKALVGYGEAHAVEVYPPDAEVVNDANLRHLWIMAAPLPWKLT